MSIRAFIAVEIENPQVLGRLISVKEALMSTGADIKPVEDENIHLTIRFLGNISTITLERIKALMSEIPKSVKKFEIRIRGLGAFPNINRPRVVWAGVTEGVEELSRIRRLIDDGIAKERLYDVHRDQHEFSPHITLARVRSGRNVDKLIKVLSEYIDYDFGVSPVTKLKLKQSTLTPRGPIYRDLFVVELG